MNKLLTVKAESGRMLTCVLDAERDFAAQLAELLDVRAGYGRSVSFDGQEIRIVDYYCNETLGYFDVLSIEDTAAPVSLHWTEI